MEELHSFGIVIISTVDGSNKGIDDRLKLNNINTYINRV